MAHELVLDALYPEMEEATVAHWLVHEGDVVAAGQPIAELVTDKVAYEYSAAEAGTLLVLLVPARSVVPVGTVLAVIGAPDEAVDNLDALRAANRRLSAEREALLAAVHEAAGVAPAAEAAPRSGVRATPAARRLARERGVELATLTGSGPDGIITVDDIPG